MKVLMKTLAGFLLPQCEFCDMSHMHTRTGFPPPAHEFCNVCVFYTHIQTGTETQDYPCPKSINVIKRFEIVVEGFCFCFFNTIIRSL